MSAGSASGLTPDGERCDARWRQVSSGVSMLDDEALQELPRRWMAEAKDCD
jgi:hypothetical protein